MFSDMMAEFRQNLVGPKQIQEHETSLQASFVDPGVRDRTGMNSTAVHSLETTAHLAKVSPNITGVPRLDITGAAPSLNVTGSVPNLNMTGAIPYLNMTGAAPNLNCTGVLPNLNVTGAVPSLNLTAAVPSLDLTSGLPHL